MEKGREGRDSGSEVWGGGKGGTAKEVVVTSMRLGGGGRRRRRSSVADIVHSPNNSSVVSDISMYEEFLPPNKTTTLKLAPLPNTTAE